MSSWLRYSSTWLNQSKRSTPTRDRFPLEHGCMQTVRPLSINHVAWWCFLFLCQGAARFMAGATFNEGVSLGTPVPKSGASSGGAPASLPSVPTPGQPAKGNGKGGIPPMQKPKKEKKSFVQNTVMQYGENIWDIRIYVFQFVVCSYLHFLL